MNNTISVTPLNIIVIVLYMTIMIAIAIYFYRKNTTTEQYFVANRSFPGWAIGMSMLATSISSVTFLAFPADAFAGDYRNLVINFMLPVAIIFAVLIFIPLFRRGNITSAYEYLGSRFGPIMRLYGTISFTLARFCWLGIILCLISNVIVVLTGWSIIPVIIITGIFVALYTVIGGISAVVWTDVIQGIVLLLGGFVCVFFLTKDLPGGLAQVFEVGQANNKFSFGSMAWNLNEKTFWTVAILGIFIWMAWQCGDQNIVQRYVSARSTREAQKGTILFGFIAIFTWVFFFFVGTCLFVYFKILPDENIADLTKEQIFPYFILTRLPDGVAGIVLAGVLAAAMSSVDSTLNAISAITVVDLVKPYFAKNKSDRFYLNTAKVIAAFVSVIMIVVAIIFSQMETSTMNELNWAFGSIFAGCLMGLFMLGFFTTRVDYTSALTGLAAAVLVNLYLVLNFTGLLPEALTIGLHKFWVGPVVNITFLAVAYITGWIPKKQKPSLAGLTIWTFTKDSK